MRRTQTWYGNAHDAGSGYSCQTVVGLDQKKQYLSTSHTFGRWFSRFMRGAHLRMGMVRHQNEALTSFNDGRVFIERYIVEPRHIEIQILADHHVQ